MRRTVVRDIAAATLVFGHITAIVLVFVFLHDYFRLIQEKIEIVLILSPITGVFAVAALKNVMSEPAPRELQDAVGVSFTMFSIGIPAVFIVFICYIIVSYPFGIADSPQALRITLSAVEVALGALVGIVAEKLFSGNIEEIRRQYFADRGGN
ncbi:MAG: hypothetical protein KF723_00500 [Rhizobiaceae bacterium]|nr:hypothetical protein [Rhizobiaceae bacterium]